MLSFSFATLQRALSSVLAVARGPELVPPPPPSAPNTLTFTLRHAHAQSSSHPERILWAHAAAQPSFIAQDHSYALQTRKTRATRPRSIEAFHNARRLGAGLGYGQSIQWDEHDVAGPDITDRETLLLLAKMTANAYYEHPGEKGWFELGDGWNNGSYPVGWEPDADGFRGHVFSTSDNSTVVLTIKGTTVPVVGGGGPTGRKDKLNDNLLFSCCCAKIGPTWTPVCGCHAGGWKCDSTCVQRALEEDSLFYPVGTNLYNNLTYLYPNADIWLVGHSLGGSLAALLGATFGVPVVAFEAPAERMAAARLHLPLPPDLSHITHVFHNADPIPMGTCTGVMSACASAGYAMEGKCHLGRKIVYDTVGRWNWGVSVRTHLIAVIINKLLAEDWDTGAPQEPEPGDGSGSGSGKTFVQWIFGRRKEEGEGRTPQGAVPPAVEEDADCAESECYGWEFGEWLNSSSARVR